MKTANTNLLRATRGPALALALLAFAVLAAVPAHAQSINVNFNGFTPSQGPTEVEGNLEGPAGGLGTSWNQYNDEDSTGVLVDSDGDPTSVAFTTNFSEGRYNGAGTNLTMLRNALTDFGRGATRNLTITGLDPGELYDIWLVGYRDSATTRERIVGSWTTANATISPINQLVDNRPENNGSTFVAGYNYVLFANVRPDGGGQIIFNGKGGTIADGFDDDYRHGLNGFQITPGGVRVPLELTDIDYDPGDDEITLAWRSNPGEFYGIYWSEDLSGFAPGVGAAVPAHATENLTTFGPFANPSPGAPRLFFRIGPPDLEDPTLERASGNGITVTLRFSEPLHPATASDPDNYSVGREDTLWVITSAELSANGRTVTLTTSPGLGLDTDYAVSMSNLTDLAGRPLAAPTMANFHTWDDDPSGIKVFILAGQSNMQGHGRNEQGLGGVAGAIGSLRYEVDDDPENYGHLVDAGGDWIPRSDVKVWWRDSDIGNTRTVKKGDLLPTFGVDSARFGPEYGFGWIVGELYDEPVLLIKTAWGGKNLHVDFRPPAAVAARGGQIGPYYTAMCDYVHDVLDQLETEFPEWSGMGYQIAGFGWHQGWNDRGLDLFEQNYEDNLVDLINDVRAEFGKPDLPVSIATTGMVPGATYGPVELAQLAVADPAQHPALAGGVFTIDTRPFWRESSVSPANQGFHWNQNGESYFLIGDAMGEGMVDLLSP